MPQRLNPFVSGLGQNTILTQSVSMIFDSTLGVSGAYRAATPFDPLSGNFTILNNIATTVSNSIPSGSGGFVLQANKNRKYLFVQNLSSSPLYVSYNGLATFNNFNYLLINSGSNPLNDATWKGTVSVTGVVPISYIDYEVV